MIETSTATILSMVYVTLGRLGGAYTYSFTPTSIGLVFKVVCSCGEKLDLTDYDSW